ncbi:MmgE/PrpD family protein [Sphingomonas sp. BIUV-7]|uniref:MmgE/PrpD family protein n=1 Tax=Sphingomonas natans TaxID=3063330 RepID=A0ABT8Y6V2_9SPHN|nr:MmgE/PrpD family protein [Sphingomonas sp. BIUV-7]MDO6414056.1 MmgE/PrpD family protein [Sphingomonas sp. BIUV-7]
MIEEREDGPGPGRRDDGPRLDRRAALKGAGVLAFAAAPFGGAASFGAFAQSPSKAKPEAVVAGAGGTTLTETVARYAAATSFDVLPKAVRERAKKVIFDEIACAYFGRRTDAGRLSAQYAQRFGAGPPEARIYGTDQVGPAHYVALANGTAGHGEEVDGTHVVGGHPGASIVHAASAMAERQRVSGAELINAVVLGYDVGVRLVEACGGTFAVRDRDQVHSDFLYALGCSASACRLLRLSADNHRHAMALATFQANGLVALFAERRHISKSFCNGQYAFAGISSAWMAEIGLEGHDDIIGTEGGVLAAWGVPEERAMVTRGLGTDFKIMSGNFKFYNAGQPIHTPIEAALTLLKQHEIAIETIQSVEIGMPARPLKTVDNRDMHNISVQDMVAAYMAGGGFKIIDEPFPSMLDNPIYTRLRPLVSAKVDPDLDREFPNGRGARVTIATRAGKRFSLRIDSPRGYSTRGEITWDDLAEKWTGSLPGADVERALMVAVRMDGLADCRGLFDAFAGVMR